jgi:hypothetical protein
MAENTRPENALAVLRDPEMMARFERNLRGAGMPRRRFLALAKRPRRPRRRPPHRL